MNEVVFSCIIKSEKIFDCLDSVFFQSVELYNKAFHDGADKAEQERSGERCLISTVDWYKTSK